MSLYLTNLRYALAIVGLFSLSILAASCSKKEPAPAPTTPTYAAYSIRYSATFGPSTTCMPGIDIDAEPYQVLGTSMRDFEYDFIGNGIYAPTIQQVQRPLSLKLKGKKALLTLYYFAPTYQFPMKPGDSITAELLGDNTVLANISLDYAEAQSIGPKVNPTGSDYITKSVEVTIP